MDHELTLLTTALDLTPARARALEARLPELGGLIGLWFGGSDTLAQLVPARARKRLDAWIALTDRAMDAHPPPARMVSAADVAAYFRRRLALHSVESFWALMLDSRGGVIAMHKVAQGTLTACVVHPREVFAHAIRARAAHVIVVHNHPSGDPEPSPEDLIVTENLTEAGRLMGIPVIDHVVVARAGYRSIGVPQAEVRRGGHDREGRFSPSEPVCQYRYGRGPCASPAPAPVAPPPGTGRPVARRPPRRRRTSSAHDPREG